MISILDDVPANNTIWILGDSILTEAAGHYNFFKKKKDLTSAQAMTQQLYMENMYAIRLIPPGVYTSNQAKNIPNVILNDLVDTLNVKAKVPHTVVIMINDHRFWNDTNLLTYQMERIINRFIREIRRIVEARNNSLPPRAVNWEYPRIFVTKALPMPNNMQSYPKGFKANRRRYNKLLLRGEEQNDYQSINLPEFTSENENGLFTFDGRITQKGYRSLWVTISDAIHKSDNQTRINMNKAKAKQLSTQINLTSAELKGAIDDDLSDVEYLGKDDGLHQDNNQRSHQHHHKPIKRALIDEFDSTEPKLAKASCEQSSPSSTISEYYTIKNRPVFDQHKKGNFYRNNLQFKGKQKRNNKNNWRRLNKH